MLVIPLTATPSQSFSIVLAQQNCKISVYQKSTGMYLDLYLDATKIISGVICRNMVQLVQQSYLGFVGDLAFLDTKGADDPSYEALGTRWVLMYLEASDL